MRRLALIGAAACALACARVPLTDPAARVQGWRCAGARTTLRCETVDLGGSFRAGCGAAGLPPTVAGVFDGRRADLWFAPDGARPARHYRFSHHGRAAPEALRKLLAPPPGQAPDPAAFPASGREPGGPLALFLGPAGEWRCVEEGAPENLTVPYDPPWRRMPVDGGLREMTEREGETLGH